MHRLGALAGELAGQPAACGEASGDRNDLRRDALLAADPLEQDGHTRDVECGETAHGLFSPSLGAARRV